MFQLSICRDSRFRAITRKPLNIFQRNSRLDDYFWSKCHNKYSSSEHKGGDICFCLKNTLLVISLILPSLLRKCPHGETHSSMASKLKGCSSSGLTYQASTPMKWLNKLHIYLCRSDGSYNERRSYKKGKRIVK